MNLDEIIADLLARPLEQFTSDRNARVKELKAAGQPDLAKQVAALKKPPVHLWAANQVARNDKSLLRKLNESAEALEKAQTGGAGARDLRTASERFQDSLEAAVNEAGTVLNAGGHSANEETLRRIHNLFRQAVLTDRQAWQRLEEGSLLEEPEPQDNVLSMFQAGKPAPKKTTTSEDRAAQRRAAAEERRREAEREAERVRQLQETAARLRRQAKEAAAEAERAEQRARAAEQEAGQAKGPARKRR
jgi:hypothetical protein